MDRVRKSRIPVRASFTKVLREVEDAVKEQRQDQQVILASWKHLHSIWTKLQTLDEQMKDAMLDMDCPESELQKEQDGCDGYERSWITINVKTEKLLEGRPRSGSPTSSASRESKKRTYKLPKIELKKFNGELSEWLGWWFQFKKIHEDEDLHDSDKFQYLVQSMVPATRAKDFVNSYPQSDTNYPKVIKALEERFGKKKLLKQVYVRELLKMVIHNARSKGSDPLSKMYDGLESHLRALESLGVTMDQSAEFLYPMVESSLPEDVLVAWQRSPLYGKEGSLETPLKTELDFLMEFLRLEVEGEEQRSLARSGFGGLQEKRMEQEKKTFSKQKKLLQSESFSTAAGLHVSQINAHSCLFCEKSHPSAECIKAQSMSMEDRKSVIGRKKACFSCLKPGHQSKFCKSAVRCTGCSRKHFHLLCPASSKNRGKTPTPETKQDEVAVSSVGFNQVRGGIVLLKTLLVNLTTPSGTLKIRLLFDDGSQRSYIRNSTAVQGNCLALGSHLERNSLFGGVLTPVEKRTTFRVPLKSLNGKVRRELNLTDKTRIAGDIPRIPPGPWLEELRERQIWLTDFKSESEEIDILIGADLMAQLVTGNSLKLKCGLIAVETVFGWTLIGPTTLVKDEPAALTSTSMMMMVTDTSVSQLWDLDCLGIRDPSEIRSRSEKDEEVKQHFLDTISRNPDGRYRVSLPWIGLGQEIPNNRSVAEKRLEATTRKLQKDEKFGEYSQIFEMWEKEGIIMTIEASKEDKSTSHYLPHRAVYKPESLTTPVRPGFDASCKTGRNPSLNECLEKGPNFIELIPSIMTRFREGKLGVVADIRKAFLMIEVKEADQNYLKFLWWEDETCEKIRVYRHNRVVFGVNCSPFLLGAVIDYHLNQVAEEDKVVAAKLRQSLYVDNCVTSVNSIEEYEHFKDHTTRIMPRWNFVSGNVEVKRSSESGC